MSSIDVSIIIINYKTPDLTISCLNSLAAAKRKADKWEVIIVDNGSLDDSSSRIREWLDSHDWFPGAYIQMPENKGFSAANNIAITNAIGSHILLLNSDTEVSPHAIQTAFKTFTSTKNIGACTVRLVLPNGTTDPACHRGFPTPWAAFAYFSKLEKFFPSNPLFSQYHQWYKNLKEVHDVDAVSGAFFFTSKHVIDIVGLLDERFFFYAEDLDWCYRMKQAGFRILFIPEPTVLHKKKQSGRSNQHTKTKKQSEYYFYQTMLQFYDKHYASRYSGILSFFVRNAVKIKLFLSKIL